MKYDRWDIRTPDGQIVDSLRQAGYPWLLAAVLAARGVTDPKAAEDMLQRDYGLQIAPLRMRDMDKAVIRIRHAVAHRERIAVFGDYDVDGITAAVVVSDYLQSRGVTCLRYIPRRLEDGYGLSRKAIRQLWLMGVALLITVDCGITGADEVDYAASLGMDVVVTDHHECRGALPRAAAVVDPHRPDDDYPFKDLAGVGVALKLVMALGGEGQERRLYDRYCVLAALGTVADVMQLRGENRAIVANGLAALPRTEFIGLRALMREAGMEGRPVTAIQAGFVLSPRINAAGRMGAADLAVDLLTCRDPEEATRLARLLCDLNRERQTVEQAICSEAMSRIDALPMEERSALVLSSAEWHQGVVGVVAARLCEKYACPSFLIHIQNGIGKGSCRSWDGFNLFQALESCSDLLDGFGGHALAAGFTIREENIAAFRQRMNRCARLAVGGPPVSVLTIDAVIARPSILTLEEAESLEALEPCGAGNPRPVLALLGVTLDAMQPVGQGRHLKLRLSKGTCHFNCIFFSMTETLCSVRTGDRVDAAFCLQVNCFRGQKTLQLQILDLRPSLTPSRHEQEALRLIRRSRQGDTLSDQEQARFHRLSRDQIAAIARMLDTMSDKEHVVVGDGLPLLRTLAGALSGSDRFFRAALALNSLREIGAIRLFWQESRLVIWMIG